MSHYYKADVYCISMLDRKCEFDCTILYPC